MLSSSLIIVMNIKMYVGGLGITNEGVVRAAALVFACVELSTTHVSGDVARTPRQDYGCTRILVYNRRWGW